MQIIVSDGILWLDSWSVGSSPDTMVFGNLRWAPSLEAKEILGITSWELHWYGLCTKTSNSPLILGFYCDRHLHRIHEYLDGYSSNGSEHPRCGSFHSNFHLYTGLGIASYESKLINLCLAPRHTHGWGVEYKNKLWLARWSV